MNRRVTWRESLPGFLFVLPQFILFAVFYFYPIIDSFAISLYSTSLSGTREFVGLGNYQKLFEDAVFRGAITNTLIYVLAIVFLTVVVGFFIAATIFDKNPRYVAFVRFSYYLPYMLGMVIMAMIWNFLLNPANGVISYYLDKAGAPVVNLLGNRKTVLAVIILVTFVLNVGQSVILYIAAMIGVPQDLFEAAEIDGANRMQRLLHILIPAIRPTVLYIAVINVIAVLKMFVAVQLLTGGGPNNASTTMMFYLYNAAFKANNSGLASAVGVLLFLVAILFLMPLFRIIRPADDARRN